VFQTIALRDQHLEHLATTRQQGVEPLSRLIRQRPGLRTHALGEQRQGFGIDLIPFLPRNEWTITGGAGGRTGDEKGRAATAANGQGSWSTRCR
jgi:hypothetical protein